MLNTYANSTFEFFLFNYLSTILIYNNFNKMIQNIWFIKNIKIRKETFGTELEISDKNKKIREINARIRKMI